MKIATFTIVLELSHPVYNYHVTSHLHLPCRFLGRLIFSAVPLQTDFLLCIGEIVVIIDTLTAFVTNFLSCVL